MQIINIVLFLIAFMFNSTDVSAANKITALQTIQAAVSADLNQLEASSSDQSNNLTQQPITNLAPSAGVSEPSTSTNLTNNNQATFPVTTPMPQNPILGTISVSNNPNNDGSYSVTANIGSANHVLVNVINTAKNDNGNAQTSTNNEVFRLYDLGNWTWTVTSYDAAGNVLGTETGQFTLGQ